MKMKIGEIGRIAESINGFGDIEMTAALRVYLRNVIKEADDHIKNLNEERLKLVDKYGGKFEPGQNNMPILAFYDKSGERSEANKLLYVEELADLENVEISFSFEKIPQKIIDKQGKLPLKFDLELNKILE
jgi:hypothetical protein